ncbi:MAG: sugar phosphate isomerase/epimerase [Elusimicrobia bacterium]|nr:sugar phosphate isomerase/epimerase [Elusimicrobiota bacterium]
MKIGRNFTNMLETSYLTDKERVLFKKGELPVHNMDARVQIRAKRDIKGQLRVGKEIGLGHIELDGGVPNPFLEMDDSEISGAAEFAKETGMTLSLHLPYTYVGAATCALQESDRLIAVALMKEYMDFAARIGCVSVVMHPGSVPFYQAVGEYLAMLEESLLKTLGELYPYAKERGLVFHMENNTAFDSYGVENDECIGIIKKANAQGMDIKYCFDIGHWFTIGLPQFGSRPIPDPPESIVEKIPPEMMYQVHLNDFIIEGNKFKFHPPLHEQKGFLKKENLKNLAGIFRDKGVQIVVVETAVREIEELLGAKDIIRKETEYLNEVFS